MVNISKIVHLEWHCVLYTLIILFFLELQMLQTFCIYIWNSTPLFKRNVETVDFSDVAILNSENFVIDVIFRPHF